MPRNYDVIANDVNNKVPPPFFEEKGDWWVMDLGKYELCMNRGTINNAGDVFMFISTKKAMKSVPSELPTDLSELYASAITVVTSTDTPILDEHTPPEFVWVTPSTGST